MAPQSRGTRLTQNGDHVPPPSTIAAQIVHNRSNVARQEPENKALFGKLLQEYLRDPIIEESNVETNAQLIQVVGEAGLDALLSDDPFAPHNLLEQARDSLMVIKLTINRKPDVLLYQGETSQDKPQFILWILGKILSLMGRQHLDLIQSELRSLLFSMLELLSKNKRTLSLADEFKDMLGKLVEATLNTLETRGPVDGNADPAMHLVVPSTSIMSALWLPASTILVLPPGYQTVIRDPVQAQLMVIHVLSILCSHRPGEPRDSVPSPFLVANQAWQFDCCHRILDICAMTTDSAVDQHDRTLASIMQFAASVLDGNQFEHQHRGFFDLFSRLLEVFDPQAHSKFAKALESALADLVRFIAMKPTYGARLRTALLFELQKLTMRVHETVHDTQFNFIQATTASLLEPITRDDLPTRPLKRQRLTEPAPDAYSRMQEKLIKEITMTLNGRARGSFPELDDEAVRRLSDCGDENRRSVIISLGHLPCVALRCPQIDQDNGVIGHCMKCDSELAQGEPEAKDVGSDDTSVTVCRRLLSYMSRCLDDANLRRSKIFRVEAANAIRRICNHLNDDECSVLNWKGIGPWLMRSLQSSVRELRIASARALVSYLREELREPVRTRNRLDALDFLKCLTEKNNLSVQETLTFAWGLIGKTCGEAELNLALIQLVDYLGHSHPLVSGTAYHEILGLADARACTPLELFKPYWNSLATHVIKDIFACPQKVQQLADLLGISVNDLLLLTQADTVPFLVLTRKKDVLQRIAQARGPSVALQDLWLQPSRNLASVLALLLVQPSEDPEQSAIALLHDVSPNFAETDLSALIKVDPILSACEILKYAGDCPEAKRPLAHQGLRLLATINERKLGSNKHSKSSKHLSAFLEAHILGIMSYFTDIIDAPLERQSLIEKRRALRAVEQLIIVGKSQVGIAIPQIRATLQSASKMPLLVDSAFMTWSALVSAAGEEEIESLLDQTFAVIAHHWHAFNSNTQRCAYDTIAELLKNHNNLIRDRIQLLPSLQGIELLHKFDSEISRFKAMIDPMVHFDAYAQRCGDENAVIVKRALTDLLPFLEIQQKVIHESAVSQQPSPVIARLSRALLDAAVRFKENDPSIPESAAQCLGAIGAIDPNRVDQAREKHEILMLSNFEKANEVIDFVAELLERVLVDAFHSAPTGRAQTYLAYTMQELLKFCGFRSVLYKPRSSQAGPVYQRWTQIPESVRSTLTPFFNTKYVLVHPSMPSDGETFPILRPGITHATWLRTFVFTLLHKATTENAQMVFPVLSRVIWGHDISIPTFLLPFVVLNVVVGGDDQDIRDINAEFVRVLSTDIDQLDSIAAEAVKQCSENIFQVLDYLSRWLQAKKKSMSEFLGGHSRNVQVPDDYDEVKEMSHVSSVEVVLSAIPADTISRRAVHCRSFSRALFHWEQHIRQTLDKAALKREDVEMDEQFRHLQEIYAQIDEPDAVEGMSTRLQILDPEQQILEHKRAGRWMAAQSWYELSLAEEPDSRSLQLELLNCLRSSNRYGSLLDTAQSMIIEYPASVSQILPFAAEASWITGKWESLERCLSLYADVNQDFNAQLGMIFIALKNGNTTRFEELLQDLRATVASAFTPSTTASLATAHSHTVKLHALYELELLGSVQERTSNLDQVVESLDKRLDILGAFMADKQYILGIRRAAMELSGLDFSDYQIGATWLTSARLSRKAGLRDAAYEAVLHATNLQDGAAMIEHSRLLWNDGHHRKAIQNLQSAIGSNMFQSYTTSMLEDQTMNPDESTSGKSQNLLVAKTQLLLAKWMDRAGHSKSEELRAHFLQACRSFSRWEKGHYYMGKHYLKILESEKALPRSKQTDVYLTGDIQKLVVENFLRSMVFGAKYYYETVPKMLTLWLDLAADIHHAEQSPKALDQEYHTSRIRKLDVVHKQVKKYIDRLPSYVFYTALPQLTSRINHAHSKANEILLHLILKVVSNHPQQALWTILAVSKSRARDKASKADVVLNQLKRMKAETAAIDVAQLISHGEKLSKALLAACEVTTESRASRASLHRDLGFNHKLAPCQLVVPVEKALSANLPTGIGGPAIRNNKAFPRNPVTISSFQDDVLVLSSLQRPKKLTMRGSDGGLYGLLCKPKDDLRKDQRLMEFTTMIDRGLKRDVDSSKRRLYIHTYAVTPLNEECGAIEWVDGLKPMRDIVLANYKTKGLRPDYSELRHLLDRACAEPEKDSWTIFTNQILPKFPAVLHEWFIDTFPEPEAWFTARLRYTRSCAVMSMVGNALGLGDRHGENILLEEGNGGCFHVDFNCLFDKGFTFEKPELVPFRLTHNMVDAFGVYGFEGPFRVAAELTLKTLRQYEDTLMTIMETFVYDPTTDFIAKPKKRVQGVPETPAEVLESVKAKIKGLLPGESVPLSVDGYADALIKMAVDPKRLAGMYIGWCAFF